MIKKEYRLICTDPYLDKTSLPKQLTKSFVPTKPISKRNSKLPFPSNKFDYVTAISVVEHLKREHIITLLNEFRRVIKSHGVILIHIAPYTPAYFLTTIKKKISGYIPVLSGTGNIIQRFFDRRDGDPSHVTWFTPKKIKSFVNKQGFEIVETLPFLLKSRMHKTRGIYFHTLNNLQTILNMKCCDSKQKSSSRVIFSIMRTLLTPFSLGYTIVIKSNK